MSIHQLNRPNSIELKTLGMPLFINQITTFHSIAMAILVRWHHTKNVLVIHFLIFQSGSMATSVLARSFIWQSIWRILHLVGLSHDFEHGNHHAVTHHTTTMSLREHSYHRTRTYSSQQSIRNNISKFDFHFYQDWGSLHRTRNKHLETFAAVA